jgi:hypothetical protein
MFFITFDLSIVMEGTISRPARNIGDIVTILMRMRVSSDEGEAAYDWFTRVYIARLAELSNEERARRVKPEKSRIEWPSPRAVATGFEAPHLHMDTLKIMGATLVKLGFRLPSVDKVTNGAIDLRSVTFPEMKEPVERWNFARLLIEAAIVLNNIDTRSEGLVHLVHDYVINVSCASPEHFALAWLVGPYLDQMRCDGERDPTKADKFLAYEKIVIPDILRVAMNRRVDTERVANKHWGKDVSAVERAWTSIADLFMRMGFMKFSLPDSTLRFNRVSKDAVTPLGRGLARIASIDIPTDPVLRAALRVTLEELSNQHALVHYRSKKRIHFDTIKHTGVASAVPTTAFVGDNPFADLISSILAEHSDPLGVNCFEDDDYDDDDEFAPSSGIVTGAVPAPTNSIEMRNLKDQVNELTKMVESQKQILNKTALKDADNEQRDAEIVVETAQLRSELLTLREQASTLQKEAEKNVLAVREATELAEQYRKSSEGHVDIPVKRPIGAAIPAPPPPPPPPPKNGGKRITEINANADKSRAIVNKTIVSIRNTGDSMEKKLVNVEHKAEKNNGIVIPFNMNDLKNRANGLKKINKDVGKPKVGNKMMSEMELAIAKRRKALATPESDGNKEHDSDFDSYTPMRAHFAMVLYTAMSSQV